jgi:hypothetical protein
MKISEFRKLIREEVRKVIREKKVSKADLIELIEYFKEYGVSITSKFSLKDMSEEVGLDEEDLLILLQNMEDKKVMRDIAKGNYSSFDSYSSSQFNDSYEDMMNDLGLE